MDERGRVAEVPCGLDQQREHGSLHVGFEVISRDRSAALEEFATEDGVVNVGDAVWGAVKEFGIVVLQGRMPGFHDSSDIDLEAECLADEGTSWV